MGTRNLQSINMIMTNHKEFILLPVVVTPEVGSTVVVVVIVVVAVVVAALVVVEIGESAALVVVEIGESTNKKHDPMNVLNKYYL